jgi:hypothetical protein
MSKKIPETTLWEGLSKDELREKAKEYYKQHLQGKTVSNKDKNIDIQFTSDGLGKIYRGATINAEKASVVQILDELVENAEYNNFGERKETDKQNVLGFLNFKAKAKIGDEICNLRISVKCKTDGNTYYSHGINKKTTS